MYDQTRRTVKRGHLGTTAAEHFENIVILWSALFTPQLVLAAYLWL